MSYFPADYYYEPTEKDYQDWTYHLKALEEEGYYEGCDDEEDNLGINLGISGSYKHWTDNELDSNLDAISLEVDEF